LRQVNSIILESDMEEKKFMPQCGI
jgi:hypothetical protein